VSLFTLPPFVTSSDGVDLDASSPRRRQSGICSVYRHEQLLRMAMCVSTPIFLLGRLLMIHFTVFAMQSEQRAILHDPLIDHLRQAMR
jgi:hypothetical protein